MSDQKTDMMRSFSLEQQFSLRRYLDLSKGASLEQLQELFEQVVLLKLARDVLMRKMFKQEFSLDVPDIHDPQHIIEITQQTDGAQTSSD
jgi:hypothetical protein